MRLRLRIHLVRCFKTFTHIGNNRMLCWNIKIIFPRSCLQEIVLVSQCLNREYKSRVIQSLRSITQLMFSAQEIHNDTETDRRDADTRSHNPREERRGCQETVNQQVLIYSGQC